jgi:peroxiredoxin
MSGIGAYLGGPTEVPGRESLLGQPAPEFELKDEDGNGVTLRRLTRRGPVILHLYRGHW